MIKREEEKSEVGNPSRPIKKEDSDPKRGGEVKVEEEDGGVSRVVKNRYVSNIAVKIRKKLIVKPERRYLSEKEWEGIMQARKYVYKGSRIKTTKR